MNEKSRLGFGAAFVLGLSKGKKSIKNQIKNLSKMIFNDFQIDF